MAPDETLRAFFSYELARIWIAPLKYDVIEYYQTFQGEMILNLCIANALL